MPEGRLLASRGLAVPALYAGAVLSLDARNAVSATARLDPGARHTVLIDPVTQLPHIDPRAQSQSTHRGGANQPERSRHRIKRLSLSFPCQRPADHSMVLAHRPHRFHGTEHDVVECRVHGRRPTGLTFSRRWTSRANETELTHIDDRDCLSAPFVRHHPAIPYNLEREALALSAFRGTRCHVHPDSTVAVSPSNVVCVTTNSQRVS